MAARQILSNTIRVEIPEGIDLHAELAGPTVRAYAYLLDLLIRSLLLAVISIVLAIFDDAASGLVLISYFLLEWFYPVFFEIRFAGQTPGKKAFNLVVINNDLTPVRAEASIIRNLLRAVDFLPFLYLFGLLSMTMSHEFKRLGDYAAGTLVAYKPEKKQQDLPEGKAVALPIPLTVEEQKSIISFTQRYKQLSRPRQQELANLLADLHDKQDDAAVQRVLAYGLSLLGKPS